MRTTKISPGGEAVFYSQRDLRGYPTGNVETSGILDIVDSQKEQILHLHHSNYSFLCPIRKLNQQGIPGDEELVQEILGTYDPQSNLRYLTRFRNGYPLVLFGLDSQGVDFNKFFMLFFGKEFDSESIYPISITYVGRPHIYTYEEVLASGDTEISSRVEREFLEMKKYLDYMQDHKSRQRADNRNRKRTA